jgi:nucleotide-binding universal stress UspA family protein
MTLVTGSSVAGRAAVPPTIPERILVGVDFRQPSLAAAKWAAARFGPCASIDLAHVVPIPDVPRFLQPLVPLDDRMVTGTESKLPALHGFADTLGSTDLSAHVRVGHPADTLAELAVSLQAGLVVAGRKAVDGNRGLTLQRLVRRLNVPVLVLDGRASGSPRRILAAVDDAEIGNGVVDWAVRLARYFGAELRLLHILNGSLLQEPGDRGGACDHGPLGRSFRWVAPTHTWLRGFLGIRGLVSEGRSIVAVGTPGPVILERARTSRADLIVVGRNGSHALTHSDLGSATQLVLRGAQVPVLVVPPVSH